MKRKKMNSDELIREILGDKSLVFHKQGMETSWVVTTESVAVHEFCRIVKSVEEIAESKGLLFDLQKGTLRLQATPLGKKLLGLLQIDLEEIKAHFPKHELHPYFNAFSELSQQDPMLLEAGVIDRLGQFDKLRLIASLNRFVERLRQKVNEPEFKGEVSYFRRLSDKNHKSLLDYINRLFQMHSKLLVLRLDLGYLRDSTRGPNATTVSYAEVKRHRKLFFRKLSQLLESKLRRKALLGFAWKLEYGLKKSWHYHVLILLNGQEARADIPIAKLIGEHWEAVTHGRGLYFNCNATKMRYRTCGIGLIDHRNKELREGLRIATAYMTKPELLIKMLLPGNGRTFGRSVIRQKEKSSRGRPRKQ